MTTTSQATAIITGGSRGLGRALAASLVSDGWFVIIDGRDAHAVEATAREIGAYGLPGDVTDERHRAELVATARQHTARLDLLVNNASTLGESPLPRLRELDPALLEFIYCVNVAAPLGLIQVALPLLRAAGGIIINVTSDAGVEAYEGWGGYGSSKAALEQLSNVLAVEEPDLHVWWLDPSDMRTQMHQDAFPGEDISDRPEPEAIVPAIRAVIAQRPSSGRVRAADFALVGQP